MVVNPLIQIIFFLIQIFFDLCILAGWLRIIFQWIQIDLQMPLSQFIFKITQPPIQWLRPILPAAIRNEWIILFWLIVLAMTKLLLINLLIWPHLPNPLSLSFAVFADLANQLINIFFFAIILRVIFSWFSPQSYGAMIVLLYKITEPLLGSVRRFIPTIGGFDFSPLIVLILLKMITILIVYPWFN